jgi:hypothetical protein
MIQHPQRHARLRIVETGAKGLALLVIDVHEIAGPASGETALSMFG